MANVRSSTSDAPPPSFDPAVFDEPLLQFQSIDADDVITAVRGLPDKYHALDPLPTNLPKSVIDRRRCAFPGSFV